MPSKKEKEYIKYNEDLASEYRSKINDIKEKQKEKEEILKKLIESVKKKHPTLYVKKSKYYDTKITKYYLDEPSSGEDKKISIVFKPEDYNYEEAISRSYNLGEEMNEKHDKTKYVDRDYF